MAPTKLLATPLAVMTATLVTTLGLAAIATDAQAQCGMGEVDWYSTERANVARADEMMQQGEPRKAAWLLQQTWPRIHEALPVESSIPVIADGVRLMALASVRSDGDIRSDLGWSSWTPGERARNVAWGVSRLRMLTVAEPWNTAAKTDLGEALSRAPATRDEARAILEPLATSGGMSSPEGYAALALVRVEAGDTTGAELASAACESRATNIAVQCVSLGGRVTPVVTAAR
jgi:hypothetical protein